MTSFDLQSLLRPELQELQPYLPHEGQYAIRLDANEAPPLLSEAAQARLAEVAAETRWERYPDATQTALRRAIAQRCGVTPEEVLMGTGSDELINLLLTALSHPLPQPQQRASRTVMMTMTPTFVMYRLGARARGIDVVEVPLDDQWDLDQSACLQALEEVRPNIVFIASPNNPTGTMAHPERLQTFIEAAAQSLVVVDEAYVDYSDRHQLDLLRRYDNVAVLRTLSKVGFASLRIGWLLGRPELVAELDKVRLPYNLPTPSQALATVALTEFAAEIDQTCRTVVAERQRVASALARFPQLRVANSQANFLWFEIDGDASALFAALGQRGILVRSFHSKGGRLAHCLRVTIGTARENDAFLAALEDCLSA